MKVADNREKEDEDSRKDLESKRETKQDFEEMKQVFEITCRERKDMKCARDEKINGITRVRA
jgi:ferritin-like metal-binding protein YciE